ncbi:MAG: flippase-like domain-containing protein, partial [Magnetococcales bacterium]|nr:flippase-like domain-containing protein [Magnetococcales bacterium]
MKIVKYLLSIGLVYWLVRSDQLQISSLRSHLFSSGHLWVLLLLLGNFFGQIHRWWTLLRLQEIEIPFVTMIRMGYIGQFFCITSIGSIAGEAARGFYVLKYSGTAKLAAVSTVVMDRVLGLFTYLLLGGIFTLFWLGWGEPSEVLARYGAVTLLAVGGMVLLFVLVWSPVVQRVLFDRLPVGWADVLRQIMVAYRPGRAGVWLVVGTSLLTSLTHLLAFMMASRV